MNTASGVFRNSQSHEWSEEDIIRTILSEETQRDPDCKGCRRCDDFSDKEPCAQLCTRFEAIRRMQCRTRNGFYYPPEGAARRWATIGISRWSQAFRSQHAALECNKTKLFSVPSPDEMVASYAGA